MSVDVVEGVSTGRLPPGMASGIAAGLGAGAFWGTTFVAPLVAPGFSSVDYTAGRFVACGLFSLGWMLWEALRSAPGRRAGLWPSAAQARAALGLSVLGYTGYYLLLVYGIADAGAALPALIIGTLPVWMMLLGKPEHLRWTALLPGLVLTAAGMALMMDATADEVSVAGAGHFWRGVLLAVGAMLSWLAFGMLNARWIRRHPEVKSTAWANWLGLAAGLWCLAVARRRDEPFHGASRQRSCPLLLRRSLQAAGQRQEAVTPVHHPDARGAALQALQDGGNLLRLPRGATAGFRRGFAAGRGRGPFNRLPLELRFLRQLQQQILGFLARVRGGRIGRGRLGLGVHELRPVVQGRGHGARRAQQRLALALEQEALHFAHVAIAEPRQGQERQRHERQLGAQAELGHCHALQAFQR